MASGGNESLCGPGSTRTRAPPCGSGRAGTPVTRGVSGAGVFTGTWSPARSRRPCQPPRPLVRSVARLPRHDRRRRGRRRARDTHAHRRGGCQSGRPLRSPCSTRAPSGSGRPSIVASRSAPATATAPACSRRASKPPSVASKAAAPAGCRPRGWRRATRPHPSRRSRARPRADGPIARRPARSSSARPEARAPLEEPRSPRSVRAVMPTRCRTTRATRVGTGTNRTRSPGASSDAGVRAGIERPRGGAADDLPAAWRRLRIHTGLPPRDAHRPGRDAQRAAMRAAARQSPGPPSPRYAKPGRKPTMKTRYSRALCRATTSAGASPVAAATRVEVRARLPAVLDGNVDRRRGGTAPRHPAGCGCRSARERLDIGAQAGRRTRRPSGRWGPRRARPPRRPRAPARPAPMARAVDGDVDHVAEIGNQRRVSSVADPRRRSRGQRLQQLLMDAAKAPVRHQHDEVAGRRPPPPRCARCRPRRECGGPAGRRARDPSPAARPTAVRPPAATNGTRRQSPPRRRRRRRGRSRPGTRGGTTTRSAVRTPPTPCVRDSRS